MRGFVLSLICLWILSSCTTRPIAPTRASRRAIDTLYQQKVLVLQPQMDSICSLLYDSIYAVAVDSILIIRRKDIDALVE